MSDGPRTADDSPAGQGTAGAPEAGSAHEQGSASRMILRAFMENKLAVVGVGLVVLITLFCFVGPLFWHTDQLHANLLATDQPPGKGHPLGTDDSGFDVLGRLMVGGQSSLEVGFAVALISTGFGVVYGTIAGYLSGLTDTILMRFVDVILAIPIIYLFIDLASIFRPTLLLLILVLALLSWMGPARLVRGETLSLRTREYVQAARAMGEGAPRIVFRHLVPNAIGTIVVNATFQVADAILTLAVLSYLGFSLPPPAATWGGMLENGVNFMYDGYWWQIYPAAVMIVLTVMAFNIIGDAVRDSLDVRLQKR